MTISMEHLYDFLCNQDSGSSMDLLTGLSEERGRPITWEPHEFFPLWNGRSCLSVVCYALKFCSDSEHTDVYVLDTIVRLDDLAAAYNAKPLRVRRFIASVLRNTDQVACPIPPVVPPSGSLLDPIAYTSLLPAYENGLRIRREIANTFVNMLWPEMKQFFTFSGRNETLPGFIHFLLQILNSEPGYIPRAGHDSQYYSDVQNISQEHLRMSLNMFLVYLGDIPFQFPDMELVKNVLTEIEDMANDVGHFIYSYYFQTSPPYHDQVLEKLAPLSNKVLFLTLKMEEHCIAFSALPLPTDANIRNTHAFDALFVVESLLEDIHQIFMTGRINAMLEEMILQITTLREKLLAAQSFLKDTYVPQDGEFQEVKTQLREIAYEARYLMSSFLVEDIPVLYLRHRLPPINKKLQLLTKKITKIRREILIVKESLTGEGSSQKMVITPMVVNDNFAVGSEDEMRELLHELTGDAGDVKLICINGMPGLGKTMLAKRLYSHRLITYTFNICVWCVVSKTYQKRKVLIEILMSLRNTLGKVQISEMDNESLILEIYHTLFGRRYLIVFDDVWDSAWDDLKRCFPEQRNGSRILFTTRNRDTAPRNSIFHTPNFLSNDQCWEILEKKIYLDESCPPHLQDSGKRIAAKCNGLPFAVVAIAGALSNMTNEKSIWDKVEGSLDTYTSDCTEILELSYNYLPDHLKLCFLYLGVFPEDAIIPVKKLIQLWIIEGFIQKDVDKSQEHVAEEYLMDLVNRNLVLVAKYKSTGGVKGCRVHDLFRDMCLRIATEENILSFVRTDQCSTHEKHQRLYVSPTAPIHLRPFSLHCQSFFGHLSEPSSCLPQMKRLRVMELTPCRPSLHHIDIFRRTYLLHLKYLVIDQPVTESVLINLVNLEFLSINNKSDIDVSMILLKLVRLRHLHIKYTIFKTDCNISQPNNLRSLSNIHIWDTDKYENLKSLPRLQKLKCHCLPLLPDLSFLAELESLSLAVTYFSNEIAIYNRTLNLPVTIKKLTLSHTRLPRETMSVLGGLPQLQSLKLLLDAIEGKEWTISDNGFKNLRFLKLGYLDIEQWICESKHFPRLSHLELISCNKLQMLPLGLGNIGTLQTIKVHDCSYEASIFAVQVEQEQLDSGKEALQVIIDNKRWSKQHLVFKYKQREEGNETRTTQSFGAHHESFWRKPDFQCEYCGILPIIGDRYKCKECNEKLGYNICVDCYTSSHSKPPCRGHNRNHTNLHDFEFVTSTRGYASPDVENLIRRMEEPLINGLSVFRFIFTILLEPVLEYLGVGWLSRFII